MIAFRCVGNPSRHAKMRQVYCQPTRLLFFFCQKLFAGQNPSCGDETGSPSGVSFREGVKVGIKAAGEWALENGQIGPNFRGRALAERAGAKRKTPSASRRFRGLQKAFQAAERSGFEPEMPVTRHTGLAIRRFRPLSHLSGAQVRMPTDLPPLLQFSRLKADPSGKLPARCEQIFCVSLGNKRSAAATIIRKLRKAKAGQTPTTAPDGLNRGSPQLLGSGQLAAIAAGHASG
jgi:hypothetical protein